MYINYSVWPWKRGTLYYSLVNIFKLYLCDIKLDKWTIQFFNCHFVNILYSVPILLFYYNLKTLFKTDFLSLPLWTANSKYRPATCGPHIHRNINLSYSLLLYTYNTYNAYDNNKILLYVQNRIGCICNKKI